MPAAGRMRPVRAAVDDPLRGDDEVHRDIMIGHRDDAGRAELDLMHGGHGHGTRADQPGRGGQGELQVGESAALPQPGAVLAGGDASHHHQVDGRQVSQADLAGRPGRPADRGRLPGRLAQVSGVQGKERLGAGQPGHGHVDGLAVLQRPLAHRPLRGVRVGLQRAGLLPDRQSAQPLRGGFGAGEVRDPACRPREPGHPGRAHLRPDLLPQRGLGRQHGGRAASIPIMTRRATGHPPILSGRGLGAGVGRGRLADRGPEIPGQVGLVRVAERGGYVRPRHRPPLPDCLGRLQQPVSADHPGG